MTKKDQFLDEQADDLTDDGNNKDRQFVTALARGLELLSCFKAGDRFLSNLEIAKRTGLPKPTVTRLCYTLVQLGYLNFSEKHSKYYLANKVLSLGHAFLSNIEIRQIARPMMRELAEYARASVALGVRDQLDMVYIENARSNATSFTQRLDVGSHLPLATSAIGRAYLCGVSDKERDVLMDNIRRDNKGDWKAVKEGVEQAIKDYQDRGFCYSVGGWDMGINGVAVPFIPEDGTDVLSFNCGGPPFILTQSIMEDDIGPRLVSLVENVRYDLKHLK
jgi:DNA-binding IclR family transcriptional regulator